MSDVAALSSVSRVMNAFEAVLTPEPPRDMAAFVKVRVQLAQAANVFLAAQREEAGDPLDGIVLGMDAALARQLYDAFAALRVRYSAHIAQWDNRAIAARWPDYRRDCLRLIRDMRALLDRRTSGAAILAAA